MEERQGTETTQSKNPAVGEGRNYTLGTISDFFSCSDPDLCPA